MDQIAWEVRARWGATALLAGPLRLDLTIQRLRPRGHFGAKGTVRPGAPAWPIGTPDRLKFARAIEDALTGTLYRDDAQVVCGEVRKIYSDRPGVLIQCWILDRIENAESKVS